MKQFIDDLNKWNIELNDKQLERFVRYYELLIEWNEKINLTAITDKDDVFKKHFLDSLSFSQCINNTDLKDKRILDLGTGAGFPGIPLKILYPATHFTLVDSLNKRIDFLNLVIDELGLDNITAIHSRAEDLARNAIFREQYDFVVSRAVANLSVLSEYCIPFVKVGGKFISYKSENALDEIDQARNAIGVLGCKKPNLIMFSLPNSDLKRVNVSIQKINPTPDIYPRKAGIPSKKPL